MAEGSSDNQAMFNALERQAEALRTDHCWHHQQLRVAGEFPVQWIHRDAWKCCFCGLIYDESDESKMEQHPEHGPYAGKQVPRPVGCPQRRFVDLIGQGAACS